MRRTVLLAAAALIVAGQVSAKDVVVPLATQDATALKGKRIAQTLHEPPSLIAMTAGKAAFGLFGVGAMASAGNTLVRENDIRDPAYLVRDHLGAAIAHAFGGELLPVDTTPTKATKPKELAKLHPDADFVLDVRSGGWNYSYFANQWGHYWIGYSVQVQLVDTRDGRLVSNLACNSSTFNEPAPPTLDALHADGARLFKHITTALGARCVQLLGREQFKLTEAQLPPLPSALAHVLRMEDEPAAPADASGSPVAEGSTADAPMETPAPAPDDAAVPVPETAASEGTDGGS